MFRQLQRLLGSTMTVARPRGTSTSTSREEVMTKRIGLALGIGMIVGALWTSNEAQGDLTVQPARPPIIVDLPLSLDAFKRDVVFDATIARDVADAARPTIAGHPGRLIVLQPTGLSLYGQHVNEEHKQALLDFVQADSMPSFDAWYETQLSLFLETTLRMLRSRHPNNAFTVMGLPAESNLRVSDPGGINVRYAEVIDQFSAIVSRHSLIMLDQQMPVESMLRRSLPETMRLREGRPLMTRINGQWHILLEESSLAEEVDPNRDAADTTSSDPSSHNSQPAPTHGDSFADVSTPEGIVHAES
ncbi:MAG: hypothetical protein EA377_12835, partial [Phycisphaerales bacterium]